MSASPETGSSGEGRRKAWMTPVAVGVALLAVLLFLYSRFGSPAGDLSRASPEDGAGQTTPDARLHGRAVPTDMSPATDQSQDGSAVEPHVVLRGRVVTQTGAPVPGAIVEILTAGCPLREVARLRTGAAGTFRLDDAPTGRLNLRVAGGGWVTGEVHGAHGADVTASVDVEAGHDSEVVLVVRPAATVYGKVTDEEGRGVPEAEIRAFTSIFGEFGLPIDPERDEVLASTKAEQNGSYRLDGLEDGAPYVLVASSPDHPRSQSDVFRARRDAPTRVDLEVRAGRHVDVFVLAPDGSPISGARVHAEGQSDDLYESCWAPYWSANVDGKGRVRVGPFALAPVEVSAYSPGFFDATEHSYPPRIAPVGQDLVEIRLERGKEIAGHLVDETGRPVPGATVQTEVPLVWDDARLKCAQTGTDGSFRIKGLPPGQLTLRARSRDAPRREATLDVESGSPEVRMVLRSDSPCELEAVVLGPHGGAVPRAKVTFGDFTTVETVGGRAWLSADDLSSALSASPTEHLRISVFDARDVEGLPLPLGEASATWTHGDSRRVEIRLPVERRLSGTVFGPDKTALPGATVVVHTKDTSSGNAGSGEAIFEAGSHVTSTGRDGTFRFHGLGHGALVLEVLVPADLVPPPACLVPDGQEHVELRVRSGVRPLVTVVDALGKPLGGAQVVLTEGGEGGTGFPQQEWWTLPDGTLQLPTVDREALWTLTVDPTHWQLRKVGRLRISAWRPASERIRLPSALMVEGSVRDQLGQPVVDARVWAGPDEHHVLAEDTSDDQGRFSLRGLPPGQVVVHAMMPSEWVRGPPRRIGVPVEVEAGTRDLVLEGDVGASLLVEVEDALTPAEDAPTAVLLAGYGAGKEEHPGAYQGGGRLLFRGLDRGASYTLWVLPSRAAPDACLLQNGVRASPDVLHVHRVPGRRIEGRVDLPDGVTEGAVYANSRFARMRTEVREGGTFVFRGLPDVPWQLQSIVWTDGRKYVGEAAASFDEPVTIRVELVDSK